MSDWLELELAHQLSPVAAPDELWGRVRGLSCGAGHVPARPRPSRPPALLLAVAMVVATVGAIWMFGKSPAGAPSPNRASAQVSCYACHTSL